MGARFRTRIAILEADYPQPRTAARYGSYGGVFRNLLTAGVKRLGLPSEEGLTITTWDIQQEVYPNLEDIDAILITGSRMWQPSTLHKIRFLLKLYF